MCSVLCVLNFLYAILYRLFTVWPTCSSVTFSHKAKIKTNLEYSRLFYLHHLITLNDLDLHIPYIIICHMRTTYIHSQHSLPYGHVIQRIMKIHDILIPGDHNVLIPANLCWELINMGWIEKGINGISHIISNDRPINK